MTKDEIIKKLRDMAKYPTVTLPRDCETLKAAADLLAQPEQEPVAWADIDLDGMVEAFHRVIEAQADKYSPFHNPVNSDAMMALRILRGLLPEMKRYTTPPHRKPLTDEEIADLWDEAVKYAPSEVRIKDFARAIEAAHGIKGDV